MMSSFTELDTDSFVPRARDELVSLGDDADPSSSFERAPVRVLRLPAFTSPPTCARSAAAAVASFESGWAVRRLLDELIVSRAQLQLSQQEHVFLAGGAVSAALQVATSAAYSDLDAPTAVDLLMSITSDIDLFFVGCDAASASRAAIDIVRPFSNSVVCTTSRALTVLAGSARVPVQIVTALHSDVRDLLDSFDLSACKAAYHPASGRVFAMRSCLSALRSGVILIEGVKLGQEDDLARRAIKYMRKGFDIALFITQDQRIGAGEGDVVFSVNPLCWLPAQVHGLARLLTLDRMVRDAAFRRSYRRLQLASLRAKHGGMQPPARRELLNLTSTTAFYGGGDKAAREVTTHPHEPVRRRKLAVVQELAQRADVASLALSRQFRMTSALQHVWRRGAHDRALAMHRANVKIENALARLLSAARFRQRLPAPESDGLAAWTASALHLRTAETDDSSGELHLLVRALNASALPPQSELARWLQSHACPAALLRARILQDDRLPGHVTLLQPVGLTTLHIVLCKEDVDVNWWARELLTRAFPGARWSSRSRLLVWCYLVHGKFPDGITSAQKPGLVRRLQESLRHREYCRALEELESVCVVDDEGDEGEGAVADVDGDDDDGDGVDDDDEGAVADDNEGEVDDEVADGDGDGEVDDAQDQDLLVRALQNADFV